MGFRFWRRVRIAPGLTLNLSKSGGSLSFGRRGARFTLGPRGNRTTVGIPGTGLFYTTTSPARGARKTRARDLAPQVKPEDRLTLGFFRRLITPASEEAFVDGCRELALGSEAKALDYLRKSDLADGSFLAGFIALKSDFLDEARRHFHAALADARKLGRYFDKYGIASTVSLPITNEVAAHMGPDRRGILLALVEVHQKQDRWEEALDCLKQLRKLAPKDPLIMLSLAELLTEAHPDDKAAAKEVVRTSQGIENDSVVHTALLLYQAKAMRVLGLRDGARDVLTKALRRKKNRPAELMHALRYERALVYEALGKKKRARSDLEKLYAAAPDYEDVAGRLGL